MPTTNVGHKDNLKFSGSHIQKSFSEGKLILMLYLTQCIQNITSKSNLKQIINDTSYILFGTKSLKPGIHNVFNNTSEFEPDSFQVPRSPSG